LLVKRIHAGQKNKPDGHHAEGDILGGHIVGALDFVDFVSLGHHNAVVLQNDGVGEHARLK